jgi:hypothetical protein
MDSSAAAFDGYAPQTRNGEGIHEGERYFQIANAAICLLIFDSRRQLFVLPSPSSTPFVHVVPHFIGQLELPEPLLDYSEDIGNEILDPAAAVIRQRMSFTTGGPQSSKKQGLAAKSQTNKSHREKTIARSTAGEGNGALGHPTLREIYDAVVQARDQPLSGTAGSGGKSAAENTSQLSLGGIYLDYSGPLLRQFVDGWLKNVTSPGGYGNIIGRRHVGAVEVSSGPGSAETQG